MPVAPRHVAALDGIRFVAAFAVMVSHATYQIYPPGNWDGMTLTVWTLTHLANVGMTLFFVLSGFVIHWNYRNSVQQSGGLRNFFIARWSRLYPLFLVVFAAGFLYELLGKDDVEPLARSTPFFLTFTTTWWFWRVDDTRYIFSAISNPLLGVMWSLATEAFFYLVYPFLASTANMLSRRGALAALLAIGALGGIMALGFVKYSDLILDLGIRYAKVDQSSGSSFLFWLGYHSPFMRLPSFLIGVAAAQYIIAGGRLPRTVADTIFVLCVIGIAAAEQIRSLFAMVDTSACVILFAGLCLATSSDKSRAARLMGVPLMVWGGEASYSLYLLHDPVIWAISRMTAHLRLPMPIFWVIVGALMAILLSRACYVRFERPTQSLFRTFGRMLLRVPRKELLYIDR
ncbi:MULTISPECIES: acyltransferase [unclassified Bradyrhizobium]|uniref:acyltransferase family protein n=1 Tax=unclassified Bradyrhizobium TaxID=2631580 RepID=UPI002916D96B|nr:MULTISPECIES: acyltransferase [unclassified Bradyrhizobium]